MKKILALILVLTLSLGMVTSSFAKLKPENSKGYVFEDFAKKKSGLISDDYILAMIAKGKNFEVVDKYYRRILNPSNSKNLEVQSIKGEDYILIDTIKTENSVPENLQQIDRFDTNSNKSFSTIDVRMREVREKAGSIKKDSKKVPMMN